MSLSYLHTSSRHTILPHSQHSFSSGQSYLPKGSIAPRFHVVLAQEDDYGECDESLQSYNSNFDQSTSLAHSLHNANEILWKSLNEFRRNKSSISLGAGGGRYTLQVGRETRIEVRLREDAPMVHISAVVYSVTQVGKIPPSILRRGGRYSMLMTMMQFNSELSQTSCGGRMIVCNGQFLFFQDVPIAALKEADMLHRKLEEFLLKAVEIRLLFDRCYRRSQQLGHPKAQY
jgi:hypothetical protein